MSQPLKIAALIALAGLPLVEIGLLFRFVQVYGFWALAALMIATAIAGSYVIRRVGLSVFNRVLSGPKTEAGGVEPLFDGFLQVLAGFCLILPGLVTDTIGLFLLVPAVRQSIITSGLLKLVNIYHYQAEVSRESLRRSQQTGDFGGDGVTIEGEYERVSEKTVRHERAVQPRQARK